MSPVFLHPLTAVLLAVLPDSAAAPKAAANWPQWRGPEENGHTADTALPVKWSDADVLWKTSLPGEGQSSPIVWGNQVFLTSALDEGRKRLVFAVDRTTGKLQWQHTAWTGEPEKLHSWNSWASSTCATDGEVVVAFFGRGGIHAYTLDGKPLWSRDLGTFESPWGVAACPIIVDNLVIQNCDSEANASLTALDKRTGATVWTTKRPDNRGWSTPVVVDVGGRRELVLNGHDGVRGYDPAGGKELWYCKSFNGRGEPTVTPAGDLLCVANGLSGDFYAVRPGGAGDVTSTRMAWHTPRKGGRDIPSPIVLGKFVLMVDTGGIAACYDAQTGQEYWKQRLPAGPKFTASPIAANGLAYFLSESGKTVVVEPANELKVVAENELTATLEEVFRATPTPCQGKFLIRSTTTLYCVGK